MSTIVCSRKAMAADSMVTDGHTSIYALKIWRVEDGLLGVAGQYDQCILFKNWLQGRCSDAPDMEDVDALYCDGKDIICWSGSIVPMFVQDKFTAIGSGATAALGALHMGASLKDAIRVAKKVDLFTGGRTVYKEIKKQ